jgi:hypothetical protein
MSPIVFTEDHTGPRYTYGFTNRPPGVGCQPDGAIIGTDADHPNFRWGTRQWPRRLTDHEVYAFELTFIEAAETDFS